MGWQSTLPDAIDQLVLIAQQAPELEGVDVRDGPVLSSSADLMVLYIGWSGDPDDLDAEAQVDAEGLAGNRDVEQTVIRCTAVAAAGESDAGAIGKVRRAAYGIVSGLGAAIDANRTLNQAVMRAAIGSHSLTQQSTSGGTKATVTFEVTTGAYTHR